MLVVFVPICVVCVDTVDDKLDTELDRAASAFARVVASLLIAAVFVLIAEVLLAMSVVCPDTVEDSAVSVLESAASALALVVFSLYSNPLVTDARSVPEYDPRI